MKTIAKQATCLLTLVIALTGCTALESELYPGEKVETLNEILAEESVWTAHGEAILHVRRTGSNSVVIAGLDWDRNTGNYKKESMTIILSEVDEQLFLSFKEEGDDLYIICRLVLPETVGDHPDTAILFNIDEDKFKRDAKAGKVRLREKIYRSAPKPNPQSNGRWFLAACRFLH